MNKPRRPKPEAVIDSNLFVSGTILKRGLPFALLEAWRQDRFILLLSKDQFAELQDVLNRPAIADKYQLSQEERSELFFLLTTTTKHAEPINPLPVKIRDPKDEIILAAALGGKAGYLISGDEDLLVLRDDPRIGNLQIITVREFLELLRDYNQPIN